eukprot:gb/GECH01006125.1/.p1 GENE.gb/GECH01006125.1/~~gb/GECH01006125.1/.p1  ORF type:complete len:286 (+),score=58.54 gb/GECH01006125.1/:1-858(+)
MFKTTKPCQLPPHRLSTILTAAGICSRRGAQNLVSQNRITVENQPAVSAGQKIEVSSVIHVDGRRARLEDTQARLFIYDKPRGTIVSYTSPKPETLPTIHDKLYHGHNVKRHLIPVGRLDVNTEGVMLLTNDGNLAQFLEDPSSEIKRTYLVRAHGQLDVNRLDKLKRGIRIKGVKYKPIQTEIISQKTTNSWLKITIEEGKNREVRKVMEWLGLQVNRMTRIQFGPFKTDKKRPRGSFQEVPIPKEYAKYVNRELWKDQHQFMMNREKTIAEVLSGTAFAKTNK